MPRRFRPLVALLLSQALVLAAAPAAFAAPGCPKTTELAMESWFMCQVCGVPLPLANSPEADRERAFIAEAVNRCESTTQIQAAMVAQYGPGILATPPSRGFGAAAWLVPALAMFGSAIAVGMAIMLARRRARTRRVRVIARTASRHDVELLDAALAAFDSTDQQH